MAYAKGSAVSDIVSRVRFDLSDPDGRRWSSDQIIKFLNEGLRELADEGVFVRRDFLPLTAGQSTYTLFTECKRLKQAVLNGQEITPTLETKMDRRGSWRGQEGHPLSYTIINYGVDTAIRLNPVPNGGASALTSAATPSITEEQGGKIDGNGFSSFDESGTIVHFIEGDGVCDSAYTAENVLRVDYFYFPRPSTASDTIPYRYETGLTAYAQFRCLILPNDASDSDTQRAAMYKVIWEDEKKKIIGYSEPGAMIPLDSRATRMQV